MLVHPQRETSDQNSRQSNVSQFNYQHNIKSESPFGVQKWDIGTKDENHVRRSLTLKAKVSVSIAFVLVVLVVTVVVVCFLMRSAPKDQWMPEYESSSRLGRYRSAAVSTDAAPCAVIGKDVFAKNGSAVDAAIAVLLCMGVVNPQSMGLGGGFLMVYYNRTERVAYYLDAREVAPAKSNATMFNGNATLPQLGGLAIAVPGEISGYYHAHKRFGVLPWEDLFPPTIKMCEEGIEVNAHLARALQRYKDKINMFEHIRNIFVDNETGEVYNENDVYTRPDLAKTLEIIARENMDAIYGTGTLAKAFLDDLKAANSIIEESDMLSYSPRWLVPVSKPLRGNLTLHSAGLPGSGMLLAFILGVLDGYEGMNADTGKDRADTVLALHRMIETFKFAYARRMELEDDDSKEMEEIVDELISQEYADAIRSRIDDSQTHTPDYYGVNVTVKEDHGTAHVSVVAPNGDAVVVTSTVNLYFGSMVVSPSTGILLNNEMDDFSLPNVTNYFDVPPTDVNHVRPGKRPFSSMSPAIVVDANGDVRIAVGGNGGTQITTSVAQTIVRTLWFGQNIKQAIDAPRFHDQLFPNYIEHEPSFPRDLLEDLQKMGHELHELGSGMLGIIMGIERGQDGYLYANSDYRKGGEVDGF